MIRKMSLQGVEVPTHGVKLTNGDFMVSNGDASHLLHRVCKVGAEGRAKKSFGEEKGSDFEHLDHPIHLAVFTNGFVEMDPWQCWIMATDACCYWTGICNLIEFYSQMNCKFQQGFL